MIHTSFKQRFNLTAI